MKISSSFHVVNFCEICRSVSMFWILTLPCIPWWSAWAASKETSSEVFFSSDPSRQSNGWGKSPSWKHLKHLRAFWFYLTNFRHYSRTNRSDQSKGGDAFLFNSSCPSLYPASLVPDHFFYCFLEQSSCPSDILLRSHKLVVRDMSRTLRIPLPGSLIWWRLAWSLSRSVVTCCLLKPW